MRNRRKINASAACAKAFQYAKHNGNVRTRRITTEFGNIITDLQDFKRFRRLSIEFGRLNAMHGKRIKELRIERGYTQQELADILHTSQKTISKYELESTDLNTAMIEKICKLFDVSSDYLLGIDDLPKD